MFQPVGSEAANDNPNSQTNSYTRKMPGNHQTFPFVGTGFQRTLFAERFDELTKGRRQGTFIPGARCLFHRGGETKQVPSNPGNVVCFAVLLTCAVCGQFSIASWLSTRYTQNIFLQNTCRLYMQQKENSNVFCTRSRFFAKFKIIARHLFKLGLRGCSSAVWQQQHHSACREAFPNSKTDRVKKVHFVECLWSARVMHETLCEAGFILPGELGTNCSCESRPLRPLEHMELLSCCIPASFLTSTLQNSVRV